MPLSERYQRQVALLFAALPFIAEEKDFALKSGTAINPFVRDMPRLSVEAFRSGAGASYRQVGRRYDARRRTAGGLTTMLSQLRGSSPGNAWRTEAPGPVRRFVALQFVRGGAQ